MEPLSVALHGIRMAEPIAGRRVLVLGAGPIGLAAIYWARQLGAVRIAAMAPSRRRAGLATAMGADGLATFGDREAEEVEQLLGGKPEIILECAGKAGVLDRAIGLAGIGAKIVVLGYCVTMDSFFPITALGKEVTIRFSKMYQLQDFQDTMASLASGHLDPRTMITRRIGLSDVPATFEALRTDRDQCKVMIAPHEA
ncbi:zinc-binding dehydrogenase [Tardibacter chloracetimidivorans]|uniref:zinc-binding dehydrogenase n=1 Tax=Tardibacter chloracetimidivorans TaxID=1921510 RepID=UPI001300CC7A|nr:zinc-binding dehydrogenase [Tardibacter chloracetimidivorans]